MPSIVLCLLLSCSGWFPPSLLYRLAIFYLIVPLISSLSLAATLCSVWSTYCPSFLLYVRPISTFVSERILQCQLYFFFFWSVSMVSYLVALEFILSSPLLFERFSVCLSIVSWETMSGSQRSLLARHVGALLVFEWWLKGAERILFGGCLTTQQHASVSQAQIYSDICTCCHTEIEVVDPTFSLTQSQYTDTGPTSPSNDPITPGAWQGSHRSANF